MEKPQSEMKHMNVEYSFDYYYGAEAEQFVFYRIPKVLFADKKFKDLSNDAKILWWQKKVSSEEIQRIMEIFQKFGKRKY